MIYQFDPAVNTIFVDMDGVLADFDGFVLEKTGKVYNAENLSEDTEMWTFLIGVPNLYRQLRPTPYCFDLWRAIRACAPNVQILTGIPRRYPMPDAEPDKRQWMALYFAPEVKVNFGPFSRDKWKHAKKGDILIDDRYDNIQDWINLGFGIGIRHDPADHLPTIEALQRHTRS